MSGPGGGRVASAPSAASTCVLAGSSMLFEGLIVMSSALVLGTGSSSARLASASAMSSETSKVQTPEHVQPSSASTRACSHAQSSQPALKVPEYICGLVLQCLDALATYGRAKRSDMRGSSYTDIKQGLAVQDNRNAPVLLATTPRYTCCA